MRSMRKLVLMGLAAFMLCLAAASGASADTLEDVHGAPIANGSAVTGTSTNTKLTGSFFGFGQTINCEHSTVAGTVTNSHPGAGNSVVGEITAISFTACARAGQATGSCPITADISSTNPATLTLNATSASGGTATID